MSWVFEKIMRTDKPFAKLTEWKMTHVNFVKDKARNITSYAEEIQHRKSKRYILKLYTSLNLKNINEILYF